jgi:hypothetical protein
MGINRTFLAFCRTIHIYLAMLGLFVMLGFGVTGFTAYHEDWFNATQPRVTDFDGQTPTDLVAKKDTLHIVEHLRQTFHITGAMSSFDDLDDRYSIAFKSPGTAWEAEVEKSTGKTTLHKHAFNWIAIINDLHRGRDAGRAWGWVIDTSAVLIVLACITGIVLWMALPKRRKLGIAAIFVGVVATVVVFYVLVPGPDTKIEPKGETTTPVTAN